ncbi:MAG: PilX N-terminal domain-containing pilus assembly protein [Desulfobacterales bacterium]
MKHGIRFENEKGSVTVLAVILLALLTLLGMAALSTSSIEVQIAGNELRHKLAFYAAESGAAYVAYHSDLYGPDNITPTEPHYFPNDTSQPNYVPITAGFPAVEYLFPNSPQSFNGQVQYASSSMLPRGTGYSVGHYRAHRYQMLCQGFGPGNTGPDNPNETILIGFYRIGF